MFVYFALLVFIQYTNYVVFGKLGESCRQDVKVEHLDLTLQLYIILKVNSYRNRGAGGGLANFKAACRVGTAQWNSTLAAIAAARVQKCIYYSHNYTDDAYIAQSHIRHEFHRSTGQYQKVNFALSKWMAEHVYANQTTINSYPDTRNSVNRIDDFVYMMTDTNTQIGCAASSYPSDERNLIHYLLVCAFEKANKVGHPVYRSCDKPARGCTKKNRIHRNLCDVSENFELPSFGPSCPADARVVHFDHILKQLVVDSINYIRNHTAGGKNSQLKPACGINVVRWNDNYANKAAARVRQCGAIMDNDYFSGQIAAYIKYRGILNATTAVSDALDMWKWEGNYVNQSMINSYPARTNLTDLCDAFLNIISDVSDEIGCYATTYSLNTRNRYVFFMNCAFKTAHKVGHPVYRSCVKPAVNCLRRNSVYQNLCSVNLPN